MTHVFKRHFMKLASSMGAGICFGHVFGLSVGFGTFFTILALMPFVPYYDK